MFLLVQKELTIKTESVQHAHQDVDHVIIMVLVSNAQDNYY